MDSVLDRILDQRLEGEPVRVDSQIIARYCAIQSNRCLGNRLRQFLCRTSCNPVRHSIHTGVCRDALNIPLRERNVLLLASGFAPQYSELSLDAGQMAVVTRAIDRMLQQHEPHPALVLDRHWNVVRTNEAAPRFFGSFVGLEKRPKPRNLLDLMFDPLGMRPFVEEWETVAAGLLQRVRREAVGSGAGCETPGVVEGVAGVSRRCSVEAAACSSKS